MITFEIRRPDGSVFATVSVRSASPTHAARVAGDVPAGMTLVML